MNKKSLKSAGLLLLTALIWGTAFVAQKEGMNYVGPFTYTAARNLIGGAVLLILLPVLDRVRKQPAGAEKGNGRRLLLSGAICGVALCVASVLQQYGIAMQDADTNVGKAGFISSCYTVFVPLFGLFFGRKSPKLVWVGEGIAVLGFFFLSLMDGLVAGQGLGLNLSDLLLLLCAFAFAGHILIIDRVSPHVDGVRLSCIQFFVAGVLCLPGMFLFEQPTWDAILACWLPILYAGVMSSGVAYTLQIIGQRNVPPAPAAVILSLESVFSVLAGYCLLPDSSLSGWELFGCVLVLAAVIVVQLAPSGGDSVQK